MIASVSLSEALLSASRYTVIVLILNGIFDARILCILSLWLQQWLQHAQKNVQKNTPAYLPYLPVLCLLDGMSIALLQSKIDAKMRAQI